MLDAFNSIHGAGKRPLRPGALLAAAALLLAGCANSTPPAASPTAGALVEHLNAVVAKLEVAFAAYELGDAQVAEDAAAEAYEDHFEAVEDAIGDTNGDLVEELEALIAQDIRAAIQRRADASKLGTLASQIRATTTDRS